MIPSVPQDIGRLAAHLDDGRELLRELVALDTPSRDVVALEAALDVLRRELGARRFVSTTFTGTDGVPVLVARRGGSGRPVGMIGHVDTVFGVGEAAERPFFIDELGRAHGPGVADMKGGLVALLRCVDLLDRAGADIALRVVVNGDEEVGSGGSRDVLVTSLADACCVLVFEPGRPGGELVSHRRGTVRCRLVVTGVAAHSGVAPREGANAIHDLAVRIGRIAGLAARYPSCDLNVNVVSGGSGINTVAARAVCEADVRTTTHDEDERIRGDLEAISSADGIPRTSCQIEWLDSRPPLERTPEQDDLLDAFRRAGAALDDHVTFVGTGGASDGNLLSAGRFPIVDGCGPVGGNYHRHDEYVHMSSIRRRAALCAAALLLHQQAGGTDA